MSEIKTPVRYDSDSGLVDADGKRVHGFSLMTSRYAEQVVTALNEHAALKAQVAELTEANERYRMALEKYAITGDWRCRYDGLVGHQCVTTCFKNTLYGGHGALIAIEALHPKQEEQDDA